MLRLIALIFLFESRFQGSRVWGSRSIICILNGLHDNSEINRTRSLELHSLRSCNSAELVRFISELSWRPFNMHIIERDPYTLEPWNRDSNANKRNILLQVNTEKTNWMGFRSIRLQTKHPLFYKWIVHPFNYELYQFWSGFCKIEFEVAEKFLIRFWSNWSLSYTTMGLLSGHLLE